MQNPPVKLAYHDQLSTDLELPADLLLIRILEYMTPEAMTLLLFTLIQQAKPGSVFYIETANRHNPAGLPDKTVEIGHTTPIPPWYVASFFAPRTDFRFNNHELLPKSLEAGTEMDIERLVVEKV